MSDEALKILDGVIANLNVTAAELSAAVATVDAGGRYLTGKFFAAQLVEGLTAAIAREQSPFVNRKAAAARWFCSEDEIDRQAKPGGCLTRLPGGVSPMFLKSEGDAAVREGTWRKSKVQGLKSRVVRADVRRAA